MNMLPQINQLEAELKRELHKKKYIQVLRSTIFTLLVVAHTVTGNLINTYDEKKIQLIMDKLSKASEKKD